MLTSVFFYNPLHSPTALCPYPTLPVQNYAGEVNYLVALHELYKYINKYYDQVSITEIPKQSE